MDFIENYKSRYQEGTYKVSDQLLCFDNNDKLIEYVKSLEHPKQMGAFICIVGEDKYLLEIEPWRSECIESMASVVSEIDRIRFRIQPVAEHIKFCQKNFIKAHNRRLGKDPDKAEFLVGVKKDSVLDLLRIFGISYALVKL